MAEVKRSLTPEKTAELFQTISCYKQTDDYAKLAADVGALFKDHLSLLVSKSRLQWRHFGSFAAAPTASFPPGEGFGTFVRPHHKKQYNRMVAAAAGADQERRERSASL